MIVQKIGLKRNSETANAAQKILADHRAKVERQLEIKFLDDKTVMPTAEKNTGVLAFDGDREQKKRLEKIFSIFEGLGKKGVGVDNDTLKFALQETAPPPGEKKKRQTVDFKTPEMQEIARKVFRLKKSLRDQIQDKFELEFDITEGQKGDKGIITEIAFRGTDSQKKKVEDFFNIFAHPSDPAQAFSNTWVDAAYKKATAKPVEKRDAAPLKEEAPGRVYFETEAEQEMALEIFGGQHQIATSLQSKLSITWKRTPTDTGAPVDSATYIVSPEKAARAEKFFSILKPKYKIGADVKELVAEAIKETDAPASLSRAAKAARAVTVTENPAAGKDRKFSTTIAVAGDNPELREMEQRAARAVLLESPSAPFTAAEFLKERIRAAIHLTGSFTTVKDGTPHTEAFKQQSPLDIMTQLRQRRPNADSVEADIQNYTVSGAQQQNVQLAGNILAGLIREGAGQNHPMLKQTLGGENIKGRYEQERTALERLAALAKLPTQANPQPAPAEDGVAYDAEVLDKRTNKAIFIPKGAEQQAAFDAAMQHALTFITGEAGGGKSAIATGVAATRFKKNRNLRIIFAHSVTPTQGEDLGFLPGELREKFMPFVAPMVTMIDKMLGWNMSNKMLDDGLMEFLPLAYIRGVTLNDCTGILDEAQNTNKRLMGDFITRLGKYGAKAIITGDTIQSDKAIEEQGAIPFWIDQMKGEPDVAVCTLTAVSNNRHQLVVRANKVMQRLHEEERDAARRKRTYEEDKMRDMVGLALDVVVNNAERLIKAVREADQTAVEKSPANSNGQHQNGSKRPSVAPGAR